MPSEHEKILKSIVNASGFVFQLSVMDNIQRTRQKHNWDIFSHEHPWRNNSNGDEGYIDIILKQNRLRLIIECKRTKDASWVFLNSDDTHDEVDIAKFSWANIHESANSIMIDIENKTSGPACNIISGRYDFILVPKSPESEFCSIRGSGENDKPLLERICGQLLRSIDCLLVEEMEIAKNKRFPDACIYVPIIVTNAKLELCHFDPGKVSLTDGFLVDGKFETVPFVRFRKSLTTVLSSRASLSSITDANKDKEGTILVINANSFCDILKNIEVKLPPFEEAWPWRYNR
jgi:hypothetical protein